MNEITSLDGVRILIAGCGDLGTRAGQLLAASGAEVWGLRRSAHRLPSELRPLAADLVDEASLDEALKSMAGDGPEVVIYTAAAAGFDDASYRAAYVDGVRGLLAALKRHGMAPRRWIYVSSTSVYAQKDGSWVDETSTTEAGSFGARRLLEGEKLCLRSSIPETTRVRFGGIYGPERRRLLDSVRLGQAVCYDRPAVWTNRIHVDDCARVLVHLTTVATLDDLYLGVDNEPARDGEVKRWLAAGLGVAEPPVATAEPGVTSRRMRSNKRCSNARLRASGFEPHYPSYREGYGDLIHKET